jgi:hypothetical protein
VKLEHFEKGWESRSLILLYGNSPDEAKILCEAFWRLASGQLADVAIHRLPGIESLSGCDLTAKVGKSNKGVFQGSKPSFFEWILTPSSWDNVEGLAKPFSEPKSETGARFQVLTDSLGGAVLISTERRW